MILKTKLTSVWFLEILEQCSVWFLEILEQLSVWFLLKEILHNVKFKQLQIDQKSCLTVFLGKIQKRINIGCCHFSMQASPSETFRAN